MSISGFVKEKTAKNQYLDKLTAGRKVMVFFIYFLGVISALLVLGNLSTYYFQDFFIFRPKRMGEGQEMQFGHPFEEVVMQGRQGGRLYGAWFRRPASRGVVLYFHGNSGNLQRWGNLYHYFFRLEYDFFIYDYRGFGRSQGRCSEALFHEDARKFYDYLLAFYPPEKIVIFGRSIGTAFASRLAAEVPARTLVLETPFASMPDLFYTYYPFLPRLFLFKYRLDNLQNLPKVKSPVFIFQGTDDRIVPYASAEKLKSVLKPEDYFFTIEMGRHNDLMIYEVYNEKMQEILG